MELPVILIPESNREADLPQPIRNPGRVLPGRVLVVEDEPTVAQLIVDVLREKGMRWIPSSTVRKGSRGSRTLPTIW